MTNKIMMGLFYAEGAEIFVSAYNDCLNLKSLRSVFLNPALNPAPGWGASALGMIVSLLAGGMFAAKVSPVFFRTCSFEKITKILKCGLICQEFARFRPVRIANLSFVRKVLM